jgi:hypothetical protein
MKKVLKFFAFLSIIGSAVAGAYYYFFLRPSKPQVELYFEDGSMLAFPASSPEATGFAQLADEVLAKSPVMA